MASAPILSIIHRQIKVSMKHCYLTFALMMSLLRSTAAQVAFSSNFSATALAPCPVAPTVSIEQIKGWTLYQTTNGNWDGPLDSSRCIAVTRQSSAVQVALSQINPAQPLFLRARPELLAAFSADLEKDYSYNISIFAQTSLSNTNLLETGTTCFQDLCSGAFIGIAIPDENGQPEGATRFQNGLFNGNSAYYFMESCFPT
jgi:hypothetical protein